MKPDREIFILDILWPMQTMKFQFNGGELCLNSRMRTCSLNLNHADRKDCVRCKSKQCGPISSCYVCLTVQFCDGWIVAVVQIVRISYIVSGIVVAACVNQIKRFFGFLFCGDCNKFTLDKLRGEYRKNRKAAKKHATQM